MEHTFATANMEFEEVVNATHNQDGSWIVVPCFFLTVKLKMTFDI